MKHFKSETLKLDSINLKITHKPELDNSYNESQTFVLNNVFNSHTLINKQYSFNANKDELNESIVELKFYTDS